MDWGILFNENTIDAWIGAIGSSIGALAAGLLTGWIAIKVMKKQFKYEEKKKEEQIKEGFLRTYHSIINSLSLAYEVMKILEGNMRLISDEPDQKEEDIKKYLAHLERLSTDIEKIDENRIPVELIKDFYDAKRIITTFSNFYTPDVRKFEKEQENSPALELLKSKKLESLQKVESFINKFEEYAEKILNEKELLS